MPDLLNDRDRVHLLTCDFWTHLSALRQIADGVREKYAGCPYARRLCEEAYQSLDALDRELRWLRERLLEPQEGTPR